MRGTSRWGTAGHRAVPPLVAGAWTSIAIAILGLALDACLRGLLLLADPSRWQ